MIEDSPQPDPVLQAENKKSLWDNLSTFYDVCSEASNVGIVIDAANNWHWFKVIFIFLAASTISNIIFVAEIAIYLFKILGRLARAASRLLGMKLAEEPNGHHELQTAGDLAAIAFYALSILFLAGVITTAPFAETLGWAFALCGLSIVGFFDYFHQARLAKNYHLELLHQQAPNEKALEKAYFKRTVKKKEALFYLGLLIGLTVLLISQSAVAFAPATMTSALLFTNKAASVYLVMIALLRFSNWIFSHKVVKKTPDESHAKLSENPTSMIVSNISGNNKNKMEERGRRNSLTS